MNKIEGVKSKFIERKKEWFLLFLGLFVQSLFGLHLMMNYSYHLAIGGDIFEINTQLLLSFSLVVFSSLMILYVGYLFFKNRSEHPVKGIVQYIGLYLVLEVAFGILSGILSVIIKNPHITNNIIILGQYTIRYGFFWFVIGRILKRRIFLLKAEIAKGYSFVIAMILLGLLNLNDNIFSVISAILYFLIIGYIYGNMIIGGNKKG